MVLIALQGRYWRVLVVEWVAEEGKTCRGKPDFVLFRFVKARTVAVGGLQFITYKRR